MRSELISVCEIFSLSHSESLRQKKRQSLALLEKYAKQFGFGDPKTVSNDSTKLLLNLLDDYVGVNHKDLDEANGISAVNRIISDLR